MTANINNWMTPETTEFWTYHGRIYTKLYTARREQMIDTKRYIKWNTKRNSPGYWNGMNNDMKIYHVTGLVFTSV